MKLKPSVKIYYSLDLCIWKDIYAHFNRQIMYALNGAIQAGVSRKLALTFVQEQDL